jgi:hypothetical protein
MPACVIWSYWRDLRCCVRWITDRSWECRLYYSCLVRFHRVRPITILGSYTDSQRMYSPPPRPYFPSGPTPAYRRYPHNRRFRRSNHSIQSSNHELPRTPLRPRQFSNMSTIRPTIHLVRRKRRKSKSMGYPDWSFLEGID